MPKNHMFSSLQSAQACPDDSPRVSVAAATVLTISQSLFAAQGTTSRSLGVRAVKEPFRLGQVAFKVISHTPAPSLNVSQDSLAKPADIPGQQSFTISQSLFAAQGTTSRSLGARAVKEPFRLGQVAFKVISHTPAPSLNVSQDFLAKPADDKTESWAQVKRTKAKCIKKETHDVAKKPTTAVTYSDSERGVGVYKYARKGRTAGPTCDRFNRHKSFPVSADKALSDYTYTNIGKRTKKRTRARAKGIVRMRCEEIHRTFNNTCPISRIRFGREKKAEPTNRFTTSFEG